MSLRSVAVKGAVADELSHDRGAWYARRRCWVEEIERGQQLLCARGVVVGVNVNACMRNQRSAKKRQEAGGTRQGG